MNMWALRDERTVPGATSRWVFGDGILRRFSAAPMVRSATETIV